MAHGGKREGAGRPKGATNKHSKEIQEAAREHTDEALKTIIEIMNNEDNQASVRLNAAKLILERGYGRIPTEPEVEEAENEKPELVLRVVDATSNSCPTCVS